MPNLGCSNQIYARGRSNRNEVLRHRGWLTALLLTTGSMVGCSGLATDSIPSDLLSDRSIELSDSELAADGTDAVLRDLRSDQDSALDAVAGGLAIDDLAADVAKSLEGQSPPTGAFKFSNDLPAEPDRLRATNAVIDTPKVPAQTFSDKLQPLLPLAINPHEVSNLEAVADEPSEPTTADTTHEAEANLPRVATLVSQPVETPKVAVATIEATDSDQVVDAAQVSFNDFPIAEPAETVEPVQPAPPVARTAEMPMELPPLSQLELKELAEPTDWVRAKPASASIDLSHIEFEPNVSQPHAEPVEQSVNQYLQRAIEKLRADSAASPEATDSLNVSLRLLELLQRKLADVSAGDWERSESEQQYWRQQLDAIATMLQTEPVSNSPTSDLQRHQSALQAIESLEAATDQLRSLASLQVRGGQFCSEITGFGQFRTLDSSQFRTGDQALVYVEVENQHCERVDSVDNQKEPQDSRWVTRLQASYAIYDAMGEVVQQQAYPLIEDVARNRRRDFYLHLPLTLSDLPAGDYQMQIVVEDAGRADSATLPQVTFSIK